VQSVITQTFERLVETIVEPEADVRIVSATGHNRYGIDPGAIDRLQEIWIKADTRSTQRLIVNGVLHPGQIVDLNNALSSVTVWDRRDVVLRRLSDGNNPLAPTCLELRQCRIDHRRAMQHQRHAATDGPDDSGQVHELNHRKQTLQKKIETAIADQQQSIENAYSDVDAHVSIISSIDAEPVANDIYSRLNPTVDSELTEILRPATPVTTVTTIDPHEVAVTRLTPLITDVPTWYERVIAGTFKMLTQADVVVIAGIDDHTHTDNESTDDTATPLMSIISTVEQHCRDNTEILARTSESKNDTDSIRADVAAELPDTRLIVSLPYTDDAQATVSWLYDNTTVESITYDERITITVRAAVSQRDAVQRAVTAVDGSIRNKS